jgi:hypothetical protein
MVGAKGGRYQMIMPWNFRLRRIIDMLGKQQLQEMWPGDVRLNHRFLTAFATNLTVQQTGFNSPNMAT